MDGMYLEKGVMAEPYPAGVGDEVRVVYSGPLVQAGADKIYLHMGYGSNQEWTDVKDYEMYRTPRGWETTFKVHRGGQLNFCFRDRYNTWDNNDGHNWTYPIDSKRFNY